MRATSNNSAPAGRDSVARNSVARNKEPQRRCCGNFLFAFALITLFTGWPASQPALGQTPAADTAGSSADTDATPPTSPGSGSKPAARASTGSGTKTPPKEPQVIPWDFQPYQVSVWIASDDPKIQIDSLHRPLRDFLDRDFAAIWRFSLRKAPAAVASIMQRDLAAVDYGLLTSTDPVIAVKRDHKDAVRIQTPKNVAELVRKIYATDAAIESIVRLGKTSGNETLDGMASRFESVGGNLLEVSQKWADENSEAVLLSRGLADRLDEPKPKLIKPPVDGLVTDAVENFDKVYLVNIKSIDVNPRIEVVEMDVLQRYFGLVQTIPLSPGTELAEVIGRGLTDAFSPTLRIEDAGKKSAKGLVRASGLIIDQDSPGLIRPGDVLQPMVRKNDRNGVPFVIGPIEWAYLVVDKVEDKTVEMDLFAGRSGGLQGRKNNRTFRTAVKVPPTNKTQTTLRLHAQGKPDFPLIGYEVYQRELKGKKTTFIGRTNWDGRLSIDKTDDPLRLLYVKNGGAILARLPVVPGLLETATADLKGDDLRLQAEAYIRGVQNSIIDLVAVRELFKARINLRLERGEIDKAKELLNKLQEQPDNQALADDMGKKQTVFVTLLEKEGPNQRRKVDRMFSITRDLLTKHINPRVIRDLEAAVIAAQQGSGSKPAEPESEEEDSEAEGEDSEGEEEDSEAEEDS